jgi:hypothetical protein
VLPQDVRSRFADGSVEWVHVPFGEALGHKAVPANWRVAEPWPWVHPTYTLTAEGASPVVEVTIDPTGRTPDLNRENNRPGARRSAHAGGAGRLANPGVIFVFFAGLGPHLQSSGAPPERPGRGRV